MPVKGIGVDYTRSAGLHASLYLPLLLCDFLGGGGSSIRECIKLLAD